MRRGSLVLVLLGALGVGLGVGCGDGGGGNPPREATRENVLEAARSIMRAAQFCALATVDEEGRPRVRTMAPYPPDDEMVVWLATRPGTRKVAQIVANPAVTLYYFDAQRNEYATLMGRARLVDDLEAKQRWRGRVSEELYPEWPDDYLLIEVTPEVIEVQGRELHPDVVTWRPVSAAFER